MCIFHLPNKNLQERLQFKAYLPGEIKRMQKDSTVRKIDLSGFQFPEPDYKFPAGTRFEKETDFSNAVFEGDVDFSRCEFLDYVTFEYAKFSGRASFEGAKFERIAVFVESDFLFGARFSNSEFLNIAGFDLAEFSHMANFSNAKFSGEANFSGAKFLAWAAFDRIKSSGNLSFNGAEFSDVALFIESKFSGDTDFGDTKFLGNALFDKAEFLGDVFFQGTEFSGDVFFDSTRFSGFTSFNRSKVTGVVTFRATVFQTNDNQILSSPIKQYTSFEGISVDRHGELRFEGGVCMSRVSLYYTDIRRFSFVDVEWGRLGGRAAIMEHGIFDERKRRSKDEMMDLPEVTPEHVQQIYVMLRRNLERGAGRYPEAGDFFIDEKKMRELILQEGYRWPPAGNFLEWIVLKVYGWLALYGESLARPVVWSMVTVVVFALLKMVSSNLQAIDFSFNLQMILKLTKLFPDFLMESVMAFFQMRSEPGLDILERLISVPILGSLFIALKRKFERR